jgi:AraC family transcriptional regulator
MAKAFAVTILILATFVAIAVYRTGIYKDVEISAGEIGPFILVYKVHKGPYHKIVSTIEDVESFFTTTNHPCPLAFGRYLHDPNTVDHDRLLSHGGCAFITPSEDLISTIKQSGFEMEELEKKEYVVAHFDGSPSMGPIKVYPKVEQWLTKYGYQRQGHVIELYQTVNEDKVHTRYLFEYQDDRPSSGANANDSDNNEDINE